MSNPFAILGDYPEEGPAVPAREKNVRQKDRHESGTGRRDRTKREGRGASNWGNAKDDLKVNKKAEKIDQQIEDAAKEPEAEAEEPKIKYVDPSQFFMEEEEEEPVVQEKEDNRAIAQKYLDIMTKKAQEKKVQERTYKEGPKHLDTAFLATDEALKQRNERSFDRKPRNDRPRKEGARPARKFADKPRKEGEAPKPRTEERKPRQDKRNRSERKPRDQRNSGVQHQRQAPNKNLSLNNFPSL